MLPPECRIVTDRAARSRTSVQLPDCMTVDPGPKTTIAWDWGWGAGKQSMYQILHPQLTPVYVRHSVASDSQQPHGLQLTRLLCPWDFPGKKTGMGCHFLLQRDQTQGSNPSLLWLLNCRQILYHLSHQGSPRVVENYQDKNWKVIFFPFKNLYTASSGINNVTLRQK